MAHVIPLKDLLGALSSVATTTAHKPLRKRLRICSVISVNYHYTTEENRVWFIRIKGFSSQNLLQTAICLFSRLLIFVFLTWWKISLYMLKSLIRTSLGIVEVMLLFVFLSYKFSSREIRKNKSLSKDVWVYSIKYAVIQHYSHRMEQYVDLILNRIWHFYSHEWLLK